MPPGEAVTVQQGVGGSTKNSPPEGRVGRVLGQTPSLWTAACVSGRQPGDC